MARLSGRAPDELRDISFSRRFIRHAEGSVLVSFGETKVLCTASIEERVPRFLNGKNQGWLTAEYGMLPRSTNSRMSRESVRGRQSGRTQEIQRLIGRSLRAAIDLKNLGERTITIDCDVIQADGGTRTASITGGFVALSDAVNHLVEAKELDHSPIICPLASVSVGIYQGQVVLDLDYAEDSGAQTDMNVVMNGEGNFVEIQGTAEGAAFSMEQLIQMTEYAKQGIDQLIEHQNDALLK